jgi:hypothetical protein
MKFIEIKLKHQADPMLINAQEIWGLYKGVDDFIIVVTKGRHREHGEFALAPNEYDRLWEKMEKLK